MIRGLTDVPARAGWQAGHFSPAELADPSVSGDNADPDGDGHSNFLEYALGSDPRSSATPLALSARAIPGALALDYPAPRPELRYVVEHSADLATWSTNAVADSPASGDLRTATVARGEDDRVFLRVHISPRQ
jgi:hypothetical protein